MVLVTPGIQFVNKSLKSRNHRNHWEPLVDLTCRMQEWAVCPKQNQSLNTNCIAFTLSTSYFTKLVLTENKNKVSIVCISK